MSATAPSRRGQGPGRLDPTVRGLLRAFLSPAIADRYASALQPIAVADRDAAIAGAVSTLRARFYVLPDEIAVALVEDAGWSVADVSTMLGLPTTRVRLALRAAAGAAEPRVGAAPPPDLDEVDDEAAAVEAMLAGLPTHRRDAELAATIDEGPEAVDVELSTALPRHVGLPDLEAQFRRADRMQRLVVNGTIVGVLVLAALTVQATRPSGDEQDLTADDEVAVAPALPSPEPSPSPTASEPALPIGDPVLAEARFVAEVDPATGEPGPELDPATTADDPRLWLRFEQLPSMDPVIDVTFTAPSGRSTVRPVLLVDRTPLVALRLPDELGREPGRYGVRVEADGMEPTTLELQLEAAAAGA